MKQIIKIIIALFIVSSQLSIVNGQTVITIDGKYEYTQTINITI